MLKEKRNRGKWLFSPPSKTHLYVRYVCVSGGKKRRYENDIDRGFGGRAVTSTASVHDVMCARRGGFLFIKVRRRGPGVGYKCTVQRLFNHSVCARLRRVSARSRYYYGRSNRISRAPGQSKPMGRMGVGVGVME